MVQHFPILLSHGVIFFFRVLRAKLSRGKLSTKLIDSVVLCDVNICISYIVDFNPSINGEIRIFISRMIGGRWHPGLHQYGPHLYLQSLGYTLGRRLQWWPYCYLGLSHSGHCKNNKRTYTSSLFAKVGVHFPPIIDMRGVVVFGVSCFVCKHVSGIM